MTNDKLPACPVCGADVILDSLGGNSVICVGALGFGTSDLCVGAYRDSTETVIAKYRVLCALVAKGREKETT